MVSHQHPGMNQPSMTFANLPQTMKKNLAVVVSHKHQIAPIATGHHVIQRARILKPRLPCHARILKVTSQFGEDIVKMCTLTPFTPFTDPIHCGFERVHIAVGETKKLHFKFSASALELINRLGRRVVEPGAFKVMVGASSEDLRLTGTFEVVAPTR
jgi:hypothetical protein